MASGAVVLVDTGPLVALFDPSDGWHARCQAEVGRLTGRRLMTSIAVLTEATYLLAFSQRAQRSLLLFVAAGAIEVAAFGVAEISRAVALMERFEDLPMDFADATLVVLAERLGTTSVFSLDRKDFGAYRVGRRAFRILPEVR